MSNTEIEETMSRPHHNTEPADPPTHNGYPDDQARGTARKLIEGAKEAFMCTGTFTPSDDKKRASTSRPLQHVLDEVVAAISTANAIGLKGQKARLWAIKAYRRAHNIDLLEGFEAEQEPEQIKIKYLLLPYQIGKRLDLTAQQVNSVLEKMGFQTREQTRGNQWWKLTEAGEKYTDRSIGSQGGGGSGSVRQIKWSESVIHLIEASWLEMNKG